MLHFILRLMNGSVYVVLPILPHLNTYKMDCIRIYLSDFFKGFAIFFLPCKRFGATFCFCLYFYLEPLSVFSGGFAVVVVEPMFMIARNAVMTYRFFVLLSHAL